MRSTTHHLYLLSWAEKAASRRVYHAGGCGIANDSVDTRLLAPGIEKAWCGNVVNLETNGYYHVILNWIFLLPRDARVPDRSRIDSPCDSSACHLSAHSSLRRMSWQLDVKYKGTSRGMVPSPSAARHPPCHPPWTFHQINRCLPTRQDRCAFIFFPR